MMMDMAIYHHKQAKEASHAAESSMVEEYKQGDRSRKVRPELGYMQGDDDFKTSMEDDAVVEEERMNTEMGRVETINSHSKAASVNSFK